MVRTYNSTLALLLTLLACSSVSAAEWGTLKGRIVIDGKLPEPQAINVNKDVEFCGKHDLKVETVTTGEKGALQNAFVYLYLKRNKTVPIHPDLEKVGEEPVILDNKGCRFEPHVLTLRLGQTLEIKNSDEGIGHNTKADLLKNPPFNETVSSGASIKKKFDKVEAYPATVSCSIHPWMTSHLLIRDNPYMAVSGEDGSFEIKNIPAGKHEFIFWHESVGNMKKVSLGSGGKTDRKGRAKLEIPAGGVLDLGEIKLKPAAVGL